MRIAMYCTGGIRCEKTTAWMKALDVPVNRLEGGILTQLVQGALDDARASGHKIVPPSD